MRSLTVPKEKRAYGIFNAGVVTPDWINISHEEIFRPMDQNGLIIHVWHSLYDEIKNMNHRWFLYISKDTNTLEMDLQIECDLDTYLLLKLST